METRKSKLGKSKAGDTLPAIERVGLYTIRWGISSFRGIHKKDCVRNFGFSERHQG